MSGWTIAYARYRCADCGVAAGEPCTHWCPSAIAAELDDIENYTAADHAETAA